jgi:Skp family chaperone for outer membrane proteins
MFDYGGWFDPHMLIVYGLLIVACAAVVASMSGFLPKSTLPWLLGFTLGPALAILALRWARRGLLEEIATIQKERDKLQDEIHAVQKQLLEASKLSKDEGVKLEAKAGQLDASLEMWKQAEAASKKNVLMMDAREAKNEEEEKQYVPMSAEEIFRAYTAKRPP